MSKKPAKEILASIRQLVDSVTQLVDAVSALPARGAGSAAGRAVAPPPSPAARAKKSAALKRAIKAHWDRMTPKERAARVRRMLAGRGLKPRRKTRR